MGPAKKILVVDDEEFVLDLLARVLQRDGVSVIKAVEIAQAEFAIKNTHFDAVITDLRLTGMLGREGLELIPYIQEKSPGTRIVIMTGYGSPEIEKEAYERGADFYFDKPINPSVLKRKLEELGIYSENPKPAKG